MISAGQAQKPGSNKTEAQPLKSTEVAVLRVTEEKIMQKDHLEKKYLTDRIKQGRAIHIPVQKRENLSIIKSQLKERMWLQSQEVIGLPSLKQTIQNSVHIAVNRILRKVISQKVGVLNQIKNLMPVILEANHNKILLRVTQDLEIKVIEARQETVNLIIC